MAMLVLMCWSLSAAVTVSTSLGPEVTCLEGGPIRYHSDVHEVHDEDRPARHHLKWGYRYDSLDSVIIGGLSATNVL